MLIGLFFAERQSRVHRSDESLEKRFRSASDGDKRPPFGSVMDQNSDVCKEIHDNGDGDGSTNKLSEFQDDISVRVVTFQVSMSSLMLFSAGNKQLLLEKKIREISYCTKVKHFSCYCYHS